MMKPLGKETIFRLYFGLQTDISFRKLLNLPVCHVAYIDISHETDVRVALLKKLEHIQQYMAVALLFKSREPLIQRSP